MDHKILFSTRGIDIYLECCCGFKKYLSNEISEEDLLKIIKEHRNRQNHKMILKIILKIINDETLIELNCNCSFRVAFDNNVDIDEVVLAVERHKQYHNK